MVPPDAETKFLTQLITHLLDDLPFCSEIFTQENRKHMFIKIPVHSYPKELYSDKNFKQPLGPSRVEWVKQSVLYSHQKQCRTIQRNQLLMHMTT